MVYHVRDVLESTRRTPSPPARTSTDDIIARARGIRRRRTAAAGGAAVAVAVAALGVGLANRPGGTEILTAAPVAGNTAFRTGYGEYRTGPNRIGPVGQITTGYQELPVYRDGLTWQDDQGQAYPLTDGAIRFYRPGVFDPATLGADEGGATFGPDFTAEVGGVRGFGRIMTYADRSGQYHRTALAWQYEPDAWATYVPRAWKTTASTEDALRIAGAVSPTGTTRPVKVPYTMAFVPAGWQTVAVEEATTEYSNVVSHVFMHAGPLTGAARGATVDLRMDGIEILVMRGKPKNRPVGDKDGLSCSSVTAACTLVKGDYLLEVNGRSSGLSTATVRKMVTEMKPADFTDHATWQSVGQ
ncbi:hypothetical protein GCM10010172_55430 [Paractinoplanes ferrugineus]|uniref:Uncharacterized protein n=1 Tax=Paractinoplanes ferrugineus TaxID=113564 RepID=A0A919J5I8_9ACTN|nr:hypothetical protein [Actinoplanes ferrugineus]GIE10986.1 hypothetical protein Afe05nite_28260 [Actinoplanes ferrugineus]